MSGSPVAEEQPGEEKEGKPGAEQAWQTQVAACLDGIGEQLRALARVPKQLDTVSEAVANLHARLDKSLPSNAEPRLEHHGWGSNLCEMDAERNLLVKEAAIRLSAHHGLGDQPLIGTLQKRTSVLSPSSSTQFWAPDALTKPISPTPSPAVSAASNGQALPVLGKAPPSAVMKRVGSRIPSIIPSCIQTRLHNRRPTIQSVSDAWPPKPPPSPTTRASTLGFQPVAPISPPAKLSRSGSAGLLGVTLNRKSVSLEHWVPEHTPPCCLPEPQLPNGFTDLPEQEDLEQESSNSDVEGFANLSNIHSAQSSGTSDMRSFATAVTTKSTSKLPIPTANDFRLSSVRQSVIAGATLTRLRIACSLDMHDDGFQDMPSLMLMPNSYARLVVDCLAILAILGTGFVVPIILAYLDADLRTNIWWALPLHIADVLWILYVTVNFITAFFANGEWVFHSKPVCVAYMKTWMLVDVLSVFPLMVLLLHNEQNELIPSVLVLKLMRVTRLGPLLSKLKELYRHPSVLVLKVGMVFAMVVNALSCFWRLAQVADDVSTTGMTWQNLYIEDMYWLIMTFSTVGYGDIVPQGITGRIYAIVAMLTAPAFFGAVVSLLNHGSKQIFNDEVELKVAQANQFMQKRSIPRYLQRRVEHNFRHQLGKENQMTIAPDIFKNLSPAVQRELSLELLRSTVLQFPLFINTPRPFIAEIAQAHSWVQCLPWDMVVEHGQLLQEVVFIIQGRLIMQCFSACGGYDTKPLDSQDQSALYDEDCLVDEQELEAGAWFGEKCLFDTGRIRTATGVAAVEAELAVLLATDFNRIVVKYPPLFEAHKRLQLAIEDGQLGLSELEYRRRPVKVVPLGRGSIFQGAFWH